MNVTIKDPLKVVFLAADNSGPAYHELFCPANYFHKYNLLQCRIIHDIDQSITSHADIIVFQRQYNPEALMFVRKAKDLGKVVMTICDDNIWDLPPNNPAKNVYVGQTLARYNAILKEVHAVITSTPYLKKIVQQFNPNCYVRRSLIETHYREFVSPGRDVGQENTVRIGWHLTPHHHDDYLLIENAIEKITIKYPQVRWIIIGYKLPILSKMSVTRWEYYEFVTVDAFYPALASLDFDIGIAPLVDNNFNRCKTHLKAQEYAMLGIPMVLSPIMTYSNWEHNKTCIKPATNDTKGWVEALSYLIENPDKRQELSQAAYDFVVSNYDINKYIFERAQIYYDVHAMVKGYEPVKIWEGSYYDTELMQNREAADGKV